MSRPLLPRSAPALAALALSLAASLALSGAARATAFRLPLSDCDQTTQCVDSNKCTVTAYYDHGGKDWNCGSEQYAGHVGTDFGVQGSYGVRPVVAGARGQVLETNDGCGIGSWGSNLRRRFGNYVKLLHADGRRPSTATSRRAP
jgi:murein DD-endopeptidase MepM/ murein hydrolase activator NlpD